MKELEAGILLVGCIALFIFIPIALIWCLNTLFSLDILYTFWTWLAAFGLTAWARMRVKR